MKGRAALPRVGSAVLAMLALAVGTLPARAAPTHFWVDNGAGPRQATARLLASTPQVRIYAVQGTRATPWAARALAQTIARHVLPTDLRLFGRPAHFSRFTVLLAPLAGSTLGYFNENDLATDAGPTSNHQNIVYVRPASLMPDGNGVADVDEAVSHELQHLIEYRIRILDRGEQPQDLWLNEGLSFYAQVASRYWTERDVLKERAAFALPGWPLPGLDQLDANVISHARAAYGRAGLFVTYLAAQYPPALTRLLVAQPQPGMAGLDRVLRTLPGHRSAAQAFANWGVATYVNVPGQYGFGRYSRLITDRPASSVLHLGRRLTYWSAPLAPWGQSYVSLVPHGGGTLELHLARCRDPLKVAAIIESADGVTPPIIRWFQGNTLQIPHVGALYSRVILAISNVGGPERPVPVTFSAQLVNVHRRHPRPAPVAW